MMRARNIIRKTTVILPNGIRSALHYQYEKYLYFRYLKQRFGDRFRWGSAGPPAPPELIETEALMYADDLRVRGKPQWYLGRGRMAAWSILSKMDQCGANTSSMRSILEFGCGSARVLRHFRYIEGLHLAGTDANPKPIEWAKKNLPGIEFSCNGLQPPLSYSDESFDLIYALSVFNHIPIAWQEAWVDELRRVLRPGGYLLCTVHGEYCINSMLNDEDRNKLETEGHLTLGAKNPQASYSTQVLGSWDVFQSPDEICRVFGKHLELLSYEREPAAAAYSHDTLILRKSPGPV